MRKISSFALFAFLMPLAGCPAGDDGETDTVVGTTTMTPATGTDTAGETVAPETAGETEVETADTTAGGGGAGFCGQTCEAAADCGTPETDWACNDGFCDYIGTLPACDPATCDDLMIGVCADVGGVSVCTTPCSDDTMCVAGFTECTGMDDDGNMICAALPTPPCGGAAEGEPCTFGGTDQFGVCTDGVCACADDTECTAMGQACNN